MLNEIFEIANQAYILQQQSDTDEIDARNWREWTKLFKQQESIKVAYVEGKPDFDEDDDMIVGSTQVDMEEEALRKADFTLDDEELNDYLKNQGQWTTSLITDENNKVSIADILTSGEPVAGKGAKGAPVESKLKEEEMVVPNEMPVNNILGDVVEQIIYINYDGEKEIIKPDVARHLPLRVSIIGKSFSGKKTQAQMLAEKYNLIQYHPYELINEALERADQELENIDEEHIEKEEQPKESEGETPVDEGEGKEDTPDEGEQTAEAKQGEGELPTEGEPQIEETKVHDGESKDIVIGENHEHIEIIQNNSHEEVLDVEADFERHGSHDATHPMKRQEKFEKLRRNIFRQIGK
jgi:hypothetical protein